MFKMDEEERFKRIVYTCMIFAILVLIGLSIFLWHNIEYVKLFKANPCGICMKENPSCFCSCIPRIPVP